MGKLFSFLILLMLPLIAVAQSAQSTTHKGFQLYGIYVQWGYNNAWYTKSNIHFRLNNGDEFTLHRAKAHQRPSFDAIYKHPLDISIPQYNYRLGVYLNKAHTKAIELNFDHTKYVVTDGQSVRVTGTIAGEQIDENKVLDPETFLHFEHTDGANWLHLNYVNQNTLFFSHKLQRNILSYIWKAGAGINIPRTDFTYHGDRLNNKFHIAGFNVSAEGGVRAYPFNCLFIELTGKTGFVDYMNALANTESMKGNRAHHTFEYFEVIATIGVDINFGRNKNPERNAQ